MTAPTIPDHGYIDGLDPETYHAHPALSSGQARTLLKSPARYRYELGLGVTPTREMLIGTCVHTEVLGAGQDWTVLPGEDMRTKAVKDRAVEIEAAGEIALKPSEARLVLGMADAVRAHPEAGRLFVAGAGVPERALFWTDPATGVPCRALVDWTLTSGRGLVDLKTTGDASRTAIPRHMARHGYPLQAAHYRRGFWAVGKPTVVDPEFAWVFVEREPPHMVTVCTLSPADMQWADEQISLAYQMHRDCTEAGYWPNGDEYPDGIVTVSLPPWSRRSVEEETPEW